LEDSRSTRRRLQNYSTPAGLDYEELGGLVRPGAAGLLIGVEYSRVRDSVWDVPYPLVTTRLDIELVDIQENYSIVSE